MLEPETGACIENMQDTLGRMTWPKLMTLISGAAREVISGQPGVIPDEEETTCNGQNRVYIGSVPFKELQDLRQQRAENHCPRRSGRSPALPDRRRDEGGRGERKATVRQLDFPLIAHRNVERLAP